MNADDEVVYYWTGAIYNQVEADPYGEAVSDWGSPILRFEGFNIARFRNRGGGVYDMLTREITVYQNMGGRIIDCWNNGAAGVEDREDVAVVHVQNDPVNFQVSGTDYVEVGDHISFSFEVQLAYESALTVDEYPDHSAGNTYQSMEMFNFYASRADLEDDSQQSVPAHISWTRVGQYLPWMKMGQTPGKLVYHAQGYKVMDGWDGLPEDLKDWVLTNAPEYQHAPERWGSGENMTSWRYFDEIVRAGEYDGRCSDG
ncbi:MAG: hypothetical protein CL927_12440 [Deltaproteobacteria bacterium]|nr:hypothetical protein [Deltaproteobacteria bacterium]